MKLMIITGITNTMPIKKNVFHNVREYRSPKIIIAKTLGSNAPVILPIYINAEFRPFDLSSGEQLTNSLFIATRKMEAQTKNMARNIPNIISELRFKINNTNEMNIPKALIITSSLAFERSLSK